MENHPNLEEYLADTLRTVQVFHNTPVTLNASSEDTLTYQLLEDWNSRIQPIQRAKNIAAAAAAVVIHISSGKRKGIQILASHRRKKRTTNKKRFRVQPMEILLRGVDDGYIKNEYRMSQKSVMKLHSLIQQDLTTAREKRSDVIQSLTKVLVGLRYLGGSRWVDISRIHGLSKESVFRCVRQFSDACAKHPQVGKIKFPCNEMEAELYAQEWAKLSGPIGSGRCGVLNKCIGAIDGLLIKTRPPSKRETVRGIDFYSGHKKAVGLNAQVLCDAKKRVVYLSVRCPGKTNDLLAYQASNLSSLIEGLPDGYFVVGDNAYVNTNHLLVPFPGQISSTDPRDAFNFYLSQLRVRVENCFALIVGRWGVLWGPLRMPLRRQPMVIKAICCLHNFCIDEGDIKPDKGPLVSQYSNEYTTTDENGVLVDCAWRTNYSFQRSVVFNSLRDDLVSFMASENLERPVSSRAMTS